MMGDVGSWASAHLLAVNAMAIGEIASLPLPRLYVLRRSLVVVIQVVSQYFFGKKVFAMAPLHHHFELKGWSEEKTIMRFWVIHFIFVVFGFWLALH